MDDVAHLWGGVVCVQKLEEQDMKALTMKEQLQREHRYLKRRLEQLSVSGSMERIRTDSMGSTISTDSEQGQAGLTNTRPGLFNPTAQGASY